MFSNFSGRQGMSIFTNRRRRPRQAVYASPQSQTTTTFTTDVPDEQLADMVQDFDPGPRNNYNFVSNHRPSTQYSDTSSTRSNSQSRNLPPMLKHPNNRFNQENNQPKFENNFSASSRADNGISLAQQKPVLNSKPSWQTGNYSVNKQQNSSSTEFRFDNRNLVKQQSQPMQNQYSWSNTNTHSPMKASNAGGVAKQPRENDKASFGATQNKYKKIKMENETNKPVISSTESFTLKTVDKSMKFVTSTIQGLRKWSEHREEVPITFEIFATLDSVPTSNNNGTAKLFSIKDSTGMIRCTYWEMDQKLSRMARGQTYRLVGALERKTGHFQCFTVRQAQPDEQKCVDGQATVCDNALIKVFSMMAEA